jgi:hypothetical protein
MATANGAGSFPSARHLGSSRGRRHGVPAAHNNDLWDCLPNGADADLLSDGCVRIGTLNDLTAEWTGGIFDASGKHFYVSVQHNISGRWTILDITGWQ